MNEQTASETTSSNVADDNVEALFELYEGEQGSNELERAAAFCTAQQLELESRARDLLKQAQKTTDVSMVASLKEQASDISSSCLRIQEFAKQYHEKRLPWTYFAGGTRIVSLLSDVYQVINRLETNNDGNIERWVHTSTFERHTKKYWINEGFLPHVLLYCVSQVPLLVYGQSGLITKNDSENTNLTDIWKTLATPVTTVYFDSPDMKLYGRRVARQEGATLFRVRWYGDKRPTGDQVLFLELKTHHEKWIIDKSVKQRVSLCERDMATLLARNDGNEWNRAFMEELVLRATPTLDDGDDLEEAIALLYQIRTLIVKKDLRPCVRTHYLRMAFQSNDSNARRLTIDRDIFMSDESSALPGQWCMDTKTRDTIKIPNAVLEVKLAESESPTFIDELFEIQAVEDADKFSKYLTGAIKFHSETIKTTPYWVALPLFDGLFGRNERSDEATLVSAVPSTKTPRDTRRYSNFSVTSLRRRSSVTPSGTTAQDLAKVRKVRIEPKTYFANERTYIQWVSVALLLVTIATLLLGIAIEQGLQAPRVMSIVLVFCSLFIATYAFAIYFRRLYLLKNGLSYGYIDHTGPIILSAAVLMGVIGLLYYSFNVDSAEASTTTVYIVASVDPQGGCKRHNFTGISLLEYQPSDILLDDTGSTKMLIIPSQSKITGLPLDEGEQEIRVLGEVPGTDIEGIAYAKGMLFAVSESKGDSSLMAFEPRMVGTRTFFDLVGQWKLEGRSFTEGIAYANDGKLHISEGAGEVGENSHVFVYDIPTIGNSTTATEESIYPLSELNGKVLTSGIAPEATKMGSMTFFEGVLYILHDNARVVRGWDLESGTLISEWILPRVEGGFDQQWEGMTLERVSNRGRNMLRGEPSVNSSSVVLYMALDSSPQIWSFQLKETEVEKQYTFPDCAAAF